MKSVKGLRLLESVDRHAFAWAAVLILSTTALRFFFVASGQLNLVQDEAQYWDWTRHLQLSYYSKGPLIAWVIHFWTSIFGSTELGVRMGALVNGCLIQCLLFWGVARLMGRPRLAVLALLIANTAPLFQAVCMLMTTDNPLLVCWISGLFALYATAVRPESKSPYYVLFFAMAIGNLAKYMMLFQMVVALCFGLLLMRHSLMRARHLKKILLVMALGGFVGYIPILIWNIQNDWVTFRHVSTLAGLGGTTSSLLRWDTPPEYLGLELGIILPWWLLLMLFACWRALKAAWTGEDPDFQALQQISALRVEDMSPKRQIVRNALFVAGFLPMWGGLFLWSFHTRVYPNWCGMSYATGFLLAAAGLERLLAGIGRKNRSPWGMAWIYSSAAVFVLTLCLTLLPLPPKLDPAMRLKGWADMGQKLESLQQEFPDPKRVFFLTDYYDVTAEVAFYGPGQPYTYLADFGRRRAQYDLWHNPVQDGRQGWDALYVTQSAEVPRQIYDMFDDVKIMPYSSTHNGRHGRKFTLVMLRNFNGHWPQTAHARY